MISSIEQGTFVVEITAGLSILALATWMGVVWRSIRRLEDRLEKHQIDSEKRLVKLEMHDKYEDKRNAVNGN